MSGLGVVEVCHEGCKDVCERGECEIPVPLGERIGMRKVAALIIEVLASEEVSVPNEPRGRFLKALLEVASWLRSDNAGRA